MDAGGSDGAMALQIGTVVGERESYKLVRSECENVSWVPRYEAFLIVLVQS